MTQLFDSFGRKIEYLRISVTDRCNLRCIYCMPSSGVIHKHQDEILSFEEITELAKIFISFGVNKIKITGGEPLVRKGITEFIQKLTKLDGLEDISITTNGILLKEYAEELKKAGLTRINVSLDTLDEEKFRFITKTGKLSDVLDGLDRVRELKFYPIKINTVVIRGINDDEILNFARLSIENPYEIRFIEYMPTNNSIGWNKNKFISADEIKNKWDAPHFFGKFYPVKSIKGSGPAEYFTMPGALGKIGFISPISSSFCSKCNRLRLTADGKLKLCLNSSSTRPLRDFQPSASGIDLKTPLRNNASYDELKNIIISAIKLKPESNNFNSSVNENIMCQVGG